jgi:hypothetical protein
MVRSVSANLINMNIREKGLGGIDWINLAWLRDQWWALVNMVVNLWVL